MPRPFFSSAVRDPTMSFLRSSVVAALAMSATLASAQGTSTSVERAPAAARSRAIRDEAAARRARRGDPGIETGAGSPGRYNGAGCGHHASRSAGGRRVGRADTGGSCWAGARRLAIRRRRDAPRHGRSRPGVSMTRVTDSWSVAASSASSRSAPTRWLDT